MCVYFFCRCFLVKNFQVCISSKEEQHVVPNWHNTSFCEGNLNLFKRKLTLREIIGNLQRWILEFQIGGRGRRCGRILLTYPIFFILNDWLIVSCITPYQQYSGHIHSGFLLLFFFKVENKKYWYHCMLSLIKLYAYDTVKSFKNKS